MTKTASRLIVIDADIARAAGNSPDATGISKDCRDFLQAVLDICHRAVWTSAIAAEWKRHASRFSRKWRVQMAARKKLEGFEALPIAGLEARVLACNDPNVSAVEIAKDMHLVDAAIATEGLIASRDTTIRRRLVSALTKAPELKKVVWVDPTNSQEHAVSWLASGAPSMAERMLGG